MPYTLKKINVKGQDKFIVINESTGDIVNGVYHKDENKAKNQVKLLTAFEGFFLKVFVDNGTK